MVPGEVEEGSGDIAGESARVAGITMSWRRWSTAVGVAACRQSCSASVGCYAAAMVAGAVAASRAKGGGAAQAARSAAEVRENDFRLACPQKHTLFYTVSPLDYFTLLEYNADVLLFEYPTTMNATKAWSLSPSLSYFLFLFRRRWTREPPNGTPRSFPPRFRGLTLSI